MLAAGAMALMRPAVALLHRRRTLPDGMRRCAAVNLRGEASKYVLSSLGLNSSASTVAGSLQAFLRDEPTLRWSLSGGRYAARPRANRHSDIVIVAFDADGALRSIDPVLDQTTTEPKLLAQVCRELVNAYNRSRHDDDVQRPGRLWYEWSSSIAHYATWPAAAHQEANRIAYRVVSGSWLSFEETSDRFAAPDFFLRKHAGLGALNFIARPAGEGMLDLWVQIHHAAIDGAPMQGAMDRLALKWGKRGVVFPAPGQAAPARLAGIARGRRVARTQDFFDFTPLLEFRKALNARLDTAVTGKAHLSSLLIWCLARQPEFEGRRFSLAVEVPAEGNNSSSFTFLPIRPADYFASAFGPRISAYVREFNRLLAVTRRRQSETQRAFGRMALLPAPLLGKCLKEFAGAGDHPLGSVGVTLLAKAEVFLTPISDVGFEDGFLAVGNMCLPGVNSAPVGCASFAGPTGRVESYPAALRRAIGESASLV